MQEKDLKVFIDVTMNYFDKISGHQAEMAEPYIEFEDPPLLEFSGLIQISGRSHGIVYITTPQAMLKQLLIRLGEPQITDELMGDLVGEIATTISGNVRSVFGETFKISVPTIIGGTNKVMPELPFANFVVPIKWEEFEPFLVIGILEEE